MATYIMRSDQETNVLRRSYKRLVQTNHRTVMSHIASYEAIVNDMAIPAIEFLDFIQHAQPKSD